MGKQVIVESSDEDIVDLALASGFQVINPVFKKVKRAVADIIPVSARTGEGMDLWADWLRREVALWKQG